MGETVPGNQQIVLEGRTATRLNVFQNVMLDQGSRTAVKEPMETLLLTPLVNKAQGCLVVGLQSARALEVCYLPETKLLPRLALVVTFLLAVVSSNGLTRWTLIWTQLAGSTHPVES